ncbi:TIGR03619 family F420-dependent LLM class oxidoreductase [Streptomyces sp. NA04227]|uniref:TIGR03619 family F420-dependent LLM class oxidoreductase n=1 Tax=Streptomyces sp. NA04227 TaxID=2742136 RepID=UPI0015904DD7|nr:TIGR03619 family F420-dependent LLM class oxidoreductase [Streptomyces sp. NA04227]QKW07164.1 TIGR03619 family F420-dependent LLM class oxidoreductase [Streptomyces sp. NA04227]
MRIAVTMLMTDRTIGPAPLATALEERGYAGLYLPEHTHIPLERRSPYPGGELPAGAGRMLNPFVALAQAAAATRSDPGAGRRLEIGTAVALVAQHDPVDLAKQIATLDHLSGGNRLTLGIGFGWNREEAAGHGVQWRTRRALVRDRMALMRALWAREPTGYEGRFGSVEASEAHPKPVTAPRPGGHGSTLTGPRTLIGGSAGPGLFSHICEYADGWLPPFGGSGLPEALPALRAAWAEAGREPAALHVVPTSVRPTPGNLARFADLGIGEVIVRLPSAPEREVLDSLDECARYLSEPPGA